MKVYEPTPSLVRRATDGDLAALDEVLKSIQPWVYNLAVRMLGQRDDAADATQEILLKVVTHLTSFRADAAFSTWVFSIARNHLLTASTRARECPEVSLEAMAERLHSGLEFSALQAGTFDAGQSLGPQDKLEARQTALGCTQTMLMALDRPHRLAYLLDTIFGLTSRQAAWIQDISADAHRQRLSRAKARLDAFTQKTCGLANTDAACQCKKQSPAVRHQRQLDQAAGQTRHSVIAIHRVERDELERQFDAVVRMGDAAAVFRAHPNYQAPESMLSAIRVVLRSEGYLDADRPLH
jgi:RNA polymerase sigma factor (sigma-70 family)